MSRAKDKRTIQNKTDLKLKYKHCNTSSSKCSIECAKNFLKEDDERFHKPYPIFQGLMDSLEHNSLFDLVEKKKEHLRKISMIKRKNVVYQKKKQISNQVDSYINMQKLFFSEPDKYFCSNYNWYYTGGNIIALKISSWDVLLHTASCKELGFAKIKKKKTKWTCTEKYILCNHNSDIYQLDSFTDRLKTIIGVRLKNDIILYDVRTKDNSDIICNPRFKQNSEVPFVSMSLNQDNKVEYVCANVNQCLSVWDINTSKELCKHNILYHLEELENDCFSQVAYHSRNEFVYINRNNFFLIDKRCNYLSTTFSLKSGDILDYSDRFVNVKPHANNLCYISSFRDISILDLRNKKIINKCSHNFTSAPFISSYYNGDDESYFCVSSCKSDEKLLWKNKSDTYHIPYLLPTVNDSFESNLLRSPNMHVYQNIKNRVDANTTGVYIWPTQKAVTIFSCNILGDVFCHEVNKLRSNETIGDFKILSNSDNYEATDKLEFIDKVVLDNIDLKIDYEPSDAFKMFKNKRIQDCVSDLKKRKKGYSEKISAIWDDIDEERILDNIEQVPTDVTVRNWLTSSHPENNFP